MNILEIDGVGKRFVSGFGTKRHIVDAVENVTLSIPQGKCVGLVGESGCGKSTLANMILGIEVPTKGEVRYEGTVISRRNCPKELRKQIQMIYQNSYDAVNYRKTIRKIVGEPLENFEHLRGKALDKRVQELLAQVDIPSDAMNKYPRQFSLGQLQRICIARALASSPRLIIMDEPLSSLDVSVQAQILNMLRSMKEEQHISSLLISHDLEAVYYLSDSIYVMYGGQIMESIADIKDFYAMEHPYSRRLLASCPGYREKKGTESVEEVSLIERPSAGCPFANRCRYADKICFESRPQLRCIGQGHEIACHIQDFPKIYEEGEKQI